MKKLFYALGAMLLAVVMAFPLTACSKGAKVKVIDVRLTGEKYGYCVNKSDTTIMTAVNDLIEDLCGNAPYDPEVGTTSAEGISYDFNGDGTPETVTLKTIYDAVTGETAASFSAATDVPSGKTKADCLIVATNAEFNPFEFMDGNKFAGVDMWVAKILAEKLNKTLVIKDMDFDVVVTEVEQGNADIGMAGLTINHGREEHVTFSDGYFVTSQRIAVLESETAFDNCTTEAEVRAVIEGMGKVNAGAATGQTGYYYLTGSTDFEFAGFADLTVKDYDSIGLAVKNLSNKKVKLVAGDRDTLMSAVEATNKNAK